MIPIPFGVTVVLGALAALGLLTVMVAEIVTYRATVKRTHARHRRYPR